MAATETTSGPTTVRPFTIDLAQAVSTISAHA